MPVYARNLLLLHFGTTKNRGGVDCLLVTAGVLKIIHIMVNWLHLLRVAFRDAFHHTSFFVLRSGATRELKRLPIKRPEVTCKLMRKVDTLA